MHERSVRTAVSDVTSEFGKSGNFGERVRNEVVTARYGRAHGHSKGRGIGRRGSPHARQLGLGGNGIQFQVGVRTGNSAVQILVPYEPVSRLGTVFKHDHRGGGSQSVANGNGSCRGGRGGGNDGESRGRIGAHLARNRSGRIG